MSGIIFVVLSITSALELYPAPQSAYMHEKKLFVIDSILPVVLQDETALPPYEPPDITPLYNALGYEPRLVSAALFDLGDEAIYIDIVSERSFFTKRSLRKYAPDPEESRPATYYLTINANGIFLAAVDRAGLHHGLYTLAQIISSSLEAGVNHRGIPAVPHLEIRDYPDMEIRAAYLHGPAARTHIQGYAALKCNMLIFESDDFYNLEGDRLLLWQEVFNEARQSGITPVPVFQIFNVPDVFLQQNPAAVEGRSRIDGLTLSSDDWAAFTQPNLIVTPENPIRVVVDERDMHFRSDYTVSEGGLNPPFLATYASPWMLRRIPGGSIPDGAATSVTYSYAPPQSTALCPHAPETRVLVRAALQRLIEGLEPAYIHGGGKEISRINQDLRCRNRNKTHGETFLEAITLVHDIAVEIKRDMGMMIWVDALLPVSVSSRDQKDFDLYAPLSGLPGGLLLLAEFDGSECFEGGRADAVLQWLDRHHMPRIGSVSVAEPASAYRIARQIGAGGELAKGMILRDTNPLDDATRVLLGKIWSSNSQHLCWPEGLNDFFECTLWKPKFSELKEALLYFLDGRMLAGEEPVALRQRFKDFTKERWGKSEPDEIRHRVAPLFEALTRYLELEYEYARGDTADALRGLRKLLRGYCDIDLEMKEERLQRILDTIEQQYLFPPAPILIGSSMVYYRPHTRYSKGEIYEVPAQIEYVDERGGTQASFDFLADCGKIHRVDFETVNAKSIALFSSDDGVKFTSVPITQNLDADTRTWHSSSLVETGEQQSIRGDGVRGPVFLKRPLHTRYLQLRVQAQSKQVILREVRAFARKINTRVSVPCFSASSSNTLEWPDIPGVVGFLDREEMCLAAAPTTVRLVRNEEHLLIGVTAQDPMPHAIGASMTVRDAPLWQEESIEIRIRPSGHTARRFIVNLLGTQHDGMSVAGNIEEWDAGWDGNWRVQAEKTSTGWTATLMLPFSILGGAPEVREEWQVNFIRHRNNITKETSSWTVPGGDERPQYGTMVFE